MNINFIFQWIALNFPLYVTLGLRCCKMLNIYNKEFVSVMSKKLETWQLSSDLHF